MGVPISSSFASRRARRSHRKSRLGCGNCKAHRVKCDELKPACSRCVHRSLKCLYPQGQGQNDETKSTQAVSRPVQEPNAISSINLTFISSSSSRFVIPRRAHRTNVTERQQAPLSVLSSNESALSHKLFEFTSIDMALFHHCLSAEDLQKYIPEDLLRLGFSTHFLLRLLLAVAGFHLSRKPGSSLFSQFLGSNVDFHVEAERHLQIATEQVMRMPCLTEGNGHALYAASIYIFICSLARGPQANEHLAFRLDGDKPSLCLFLGLRTILEDCNNRGYNGEIASTHSEVPETASTDTCPESNQGSVPSFTQMSSSRRDYSEPLQDLRSLISETFPARSSLNASYCSVLDTLLSSFNSLYHRSMPISGSELWPLVFSWLYTLPDCVVSDMEAKRPVALLLFGFFAVLLNELDSVWFIHGWSQHIIKGIHTQLDDWHRLYLQWPLNCLVL